MIEIPETIASSTLQNDVSNEIESKASQSFAKEIQMTVPVSPTAQASSLEDTLQHQLPLLWKQTQSTLKLELIR